MTKPASLVTAEDVAQAAGVSQATVSYIFSGRRSGKTRISDETRERVLAAAAALNYVPNQTARSLRRKRTERICVVLPSLGAPTNDEIVRDVEAVANAHGYTTIITLTGTDQRERQVLDQLRRGLADGVIWVVPSHLDATQFTMLAELNLAVVVLSNYLIGPGFDVVRTMDSTASRKAVDYLVSRGHRRIAFLGHCGDERSRLERLDGYHGALKDWGLPIDERLNRGRDNSREHAYHSAKALLELDQRPTAIFAASDLAAISAIWAARDCGLRVPEDVAIMGTGNIPESTITTPPLSTIGRDTHNYTYIADVLFERLQGTAPLEGRVFPDRSTLILRGSA